MNWISEGHRSYGWLQWMRQVMAEPVEPIGALREIFSRVGEWDAEIAADRYGTGDPDRVSSSEYYLFAASMMSRAAKEAVDTALNYARTWSADDPMKWSSVLPEAKTHWETAHHVIKVVLDAWVMLWHDLDRRDTMSAPSEPEMLAQWRVSADQAAEIVTGASVAAWAQRR